jgi:hypothetical protein
MEGDKVKNLLVDSFLNNEKSKSVENESFIVRQTNKEK